MRKILGALAGCALAVACTVPPGSGPAAAPPAAEPEPAPPAACLLDTVALATASGVTWTPDAATARDTRCVYDAPDDAFLVVDLTPGADAETPAALCDEGTRTALEGGGWTCRFGEGVYGATVAAGRLVTLAAATVPAGSDADRMLDAVGVELDRITGR